MPQLHPPFCLLFRQQQRQRAERPRRQMVKHTSRSDYVYTFELQRSAGGPQDGLIHEILGCKVRSCPLPAAGSRGAMTGCVSGNTPTRQNGPT
jgi:hypothetical protein